MCGGQFVRGQGILPVQHLVPQTPMTPARSTRAPGALEANLGAQAHTAQVLRRLAKTLSSGHRVCRVVSTLSCTYSSGTRAYVPGAHFAGTPTVLRLRSSEGKRLSNHPDEFVDCETCSLWDPHCVLGRGNPLCYTDCFAMRSYGTTEFRICSSGQSIRSLCRDHTQTLPFLQRQTRNSITS